MWRIIRSPHYPTMQLLWLAEEDSSFWFILDVVSVFLRVCSQLSEEDKWEIPFMDFKSTAFAAGGSRGPQRDVVYLGWPIASSYMSPNAGGGGLQCLSPWVKLWRSNFIFHLWAAPSPLHFSVTCQSAFFVAYFKSAALAVGPNWLPLLWYANPQPS